MALVPLLPGTLLLQGIRWVDAPVRRAVGLSGADRKALVVLTLGRDPYRRSVSLPPLDWEIIHGVRYRIGVLPRLPECHQVVRYSLTAHGAVFPDRLVEQPERLGSLHSSDRIFPDADFRVVDEAVALMQPNEIAAEVGKADVPVPLFTRRQVHAVDGHKASWLQDAEQFQCDVLVVLRELLVSLAIPKVAIRRAIGVKTRERWAVYVKINRVAR